MAQFNLYLNVAANKTVAGPASSSEISLPTLYCPDTPTLQVYLLTPAPGTNLNAPFIPIATAGLTFYCYLNDGTLNGTIYTQQITWTPGQDANGPFFNATLALNTVALEAIVTAGGVNGGNCYLEFGYVQAGFQTTVFRKGITVIPGLPSNVIAPVPAGETALSLQQAQQLFVPQQPTTGQPIYLKSAAGKVLALIANDNADGTASLLAAPIN